jgi:hypothetical protein
MMTPLLFSATAYEEGPKCIYNPGSEMFSTTFQAFLRGKCGLLLLTLIKETIL